METSKLNDELNVSISSVDWWLLNSVQCVNIRYTGAEHHIKFMHCQCEPLVVTMVRAQLWPSTTHHPHLAFTFELLDWAEVLLLECQVALKDLCKALSFRCPRLSSKVYLCTLFWKWCFTFDAFHYRGRISTHQWLMHLRNTGLEIYMYLLVSALVLLSVLITGVWK